jgi:hypothetical protein
MKASAWSAVAALTVVFLAGCSATGGPGDTSDTSSAKAATASPLTATDSPTTASPTQNPSQKPADPVSNEVPSIALRKDGKTPIRCTEWPGLSNDRQRSVVFSALVQSLVIPVTDSKVGKARRMVDTDCRAKPASGVYVVALRAAKSV